LKHEAPPGAISSDGLAGDVDAISISVFLLVICCLLLHIGYYRLKKTNRGWCHWGLAGSDLRIRPNNGNNAI
jgi:hypothetical protein